MGRSQRHKVIEQVRASNGEFVAQGAINPVLGEIIKEEIAAGMPTLDFLSPDHAVIGGENITMSCLGQNFDETCIINFNGGDEATTFVSDTEVTTGINMATATTEGSFPVYVKKGNFKTATAMFGFLPQEAFRK